MKLKDGSSNSDKKPLERREFLKLGATGVAASVAGCVPARRPGALPDPESTAGDATSGADVGSATGDSAGPDAPLDAQDPSTPDIGGLVDPARVEAESWQEPWVWRPERWPDARLDLNVIRNQNPGQSTSPGNPTPSLFSYNGTSPGPTVRVRSDGRLKLTLRNTLGLNEQQTQIGPSPDPFDLAPDTNREVCAIVEREVRGGDPENPRPCNAFFFPEQLLQVIRPELRPGWSLKGHLNGTHATHVTNLHFHGLHVAPETNPDGSHSDNVLLRILPQADWEARLRSDDSDLHTLAEHEHVGELDYDLHLPVDRGGTTLHHPPGTHWYHPHPHGATHDQVASGMAGFLIVEGDVDEAINTAMTGETWPDPEVKTGSFDYRERLMLIQRVQVGPVDLDAGPRRNAIRFPPLLAVNGVRSAGVMFMRPGAVERWRVLNGSVDGAGTKRFMVLEGQFVQRGERIWRVAADGDGENRTRRLEPATEQELDDAKLPLHQLSFDGITLVSVQGGEAVHTIKDLSVQNAGTRNPIIPRTGEGPDNRTDGPEAGLRAYESCFRDGDSLRRAFVRPNEVYLGNANRADLFFKAPLDGAGRTFTVFAREAHLHSDNFQQRLQTDIARPGNAPLRPLFDVVVGYIHVRGEPVEGGDFDVQGLREVLPPVPPLLQPIREEELRVDREEAERTGVPPGSARTRVVSYSGTGGNDFPAIRVPDEFVRRNPELEDLLWGRQDGVPVLLPNLTRTMAINPDFDLARDPEPELPRKFMPEDPRRSRMLTDTAEEWVLLLSRAEGQRRFAEDPEFRITAKGSDHPFHMHINPIWVLRIDVPDESGELHNVLPEPRWMDTVPVPRNGGRVVFRTRFEDFAGTWVHHCHILLHEDMGMMQVVECTDRAEDVNYLPRSAIASAEMSAGEVDAIYPRPSLEIMYRQNLSFVDPNELGYQVYPGFDLELPDSEDE
jgi:FtsP/CotA-like multicopper oxidase with cupredoxin domain